MESSNEKRPVSPERETISLVRWSGRGGMLGVPEDLPFEMLIRSAGTDRAGTGRGAFCLGSQEDGYAPRKMTAVADGRAAGPSGLSGRSAEDSPGGGGFTTPGQ
jgi:hypothetical protein